jgi:hypothetical protein
MKSPVTQSVETEDKNVLISNSGVIYKNVLGNEYKYNQNEVLYNTYGYSSSFFNEEINVYPFRFEFNNRLSSSPGTITFKRSDGISTVNLTTTQSVWDGNHHHIAVSKSGSLVYLYLDGVLHASGSDRTLNPVNKHSITFGAEDLSFRRGFSGSMDEIRFYDYALPQSQIQTLADKTSQALYQTAVVGNVFYRSGEIVVSPLNPQYKNIFNGSWYLNYRGTHTIYQYEVLVRIKKGSFNLTHNPTARVSAKSDLLIPDMTGSLLMPYFTSIGMYNDSGELMAVAKMGQPIQMRDDVDINVLVRWNA